MRRGGQPPGRTALISGCLGLALLWSRRWQRAGRWVLAAQLIVLLLAGNKWVSGRLIHPLEDRYPAVADYRAGEPLPPALAACRYVVVLGAGSNDQPDLPALAKLSASARARLTEGVRLLRLLPRATLIVSGPPQRRGGLPHARILARAAESLGVAAERIQLIEDAHDTEQEAAALRTRVGDVPFALVTSAWHMPRAAALCRAQGLHFVPCPTDFLFVHGRRWSFRDFTWDVPSLERSTRAVHEYLGLAWSALRGRL